MDMICFVKRFLPRERSLDPMKVGATRWKCEVLQNEANIY
jgi:hypothetical protein